MTSSSQQFHLQVGYLTSISNCKRFDLLVLMCCSSCMDCCFASLPLWMRINCILFYFFFAGEARVVSCVRHLQHVKKLMHSLRVLQKPKTCQNQQSWQLCPAFWGESFWSIMCWFCYRCILFSHHWIRDISAVLVNPGSLIFYVDVVAQCEWNGWTISACLAAAAAAVFLLCADERSGKWRNLVIIFIFWLNVLWS